MSIAQNIPFPAPLKETADSLSVAEWKRFVGQWNNYVVAADLERESNARRAAILLSCIGADAYEIFDTL